MKAFLLIHGDLMAAEIDGRLEQTWKVNNGVRDKVRKFAERRRVKWAKSTLEMFPWLKEG